MDEAIGGETATVPVTITGFAPQNFQLGRPSTILITGTGLTSGMAVTLVELAVAGLTWQPSSPFSPPSGVASSGGTILTYVSTPSVPHHHGPVPLDPLIGSLLVTVYDGFISTYELLPTRVYYFPKIQAVGCDDEV